MRTYPGNKDDDSAWGMPIASTPSAFGADKYDLAADIAEDVRTLLERVTQWRSDNRHIADYRIETIYHGLAQATSAIRMLGAEEEDMIRERAIDEARRPRVGDQCDDTCTVDCGHCKGEKARAEANFARIIREQM